MKIAGYRNGTAGLLIGLFLAMQSMAAFANEDERIVFQRGDIKVTMEDVERYIIDRLPAQEADRKKVLAKQDIFKEIIGNMHLMHALAPVAIDRGVIDLAQLDWALALERERRLMIWMLDEAGYEALEGVDWDSLAKETYLAEDEAYMLPEQVHASHILVSDKSRSKVAAQAWAATLRQRALDGEDFATLAKNLSDDGSARNNAGDLGFFGDGKMVKEFETAVFAMTKENEISELVKSPFGYHIIQFHARKAARKQPFKEVESAIIQGLKLKRIKQVKQDLMFAIRENPDGKWDEALMAELKQKHQSSSPEADEMKEAPVTEEK